MADLSNEFGFTGMSITVPVKDVKETLRWYVTTLGFLPYFYVEGERSRSGVRLGKTEICFCEGEPLNRKEQWIYLDITSPDALFERYRAEGVEIAFEPLDQFWGARDFGIRDLNGYLVIFGDERDDTKWQRKRSAEMNIALQHLMSGDLESLTRHIEQYPDLLKGTTSTRYNQEATANLLHLLIDYPEGNSPSNVCEIAAYLLSKGIEVDALDGEEGSTALQLAMYLESPHAKLKELCELLIDHRASITFSGTHGMDALTAGLLNGHTACAELMSERGYPENFSWVGAGLGKMEIVQAFCESTKNGTSEEDPEEIQPKKNCAFLVAAINGQTEVVKYLLDDGMDVDMQPPGCDFGGIGGTALHRAAQHGRMETVQLLVERGANVLAEDDTYFLTPAGWAAWKGHDEVRKYLLIQEAKQEM